MKNSLSYVWLQEKDKDVFVLTKLSSTNTYFICTDPYINIAIFSKYSETINYEKIWSRYVIYKYCPVVYDILKPSYLKLHIMWEEIWMISVKAMGWRWCSVTKSCLTLQPHGLHTPSSFVLHCLLEFAQIRVLWVDDAIELSHPLIPAASVAFSLY